MVSLLTFFFACTVGFSTLFGTCISRTRLGLYVYREYSIVYIYIYMY